MRPRVRPLLVPLLLLGLLGGTPSRADEEDGAWRAVHALLVKGDADGATRRAADAAGADGARLRSALKAGTLRARMDAIIAERARAAELLGEGEVRKAADVLRAAGTLAAELGWAEGMNDAFEAVFRAQLGATDADVKLRVYSAWRDGARRLNDTAGLVHALCGLAEVTMLRGSLEAADEHLLEANALGLAAADPALRARLLETRERRAFFARDYYAALDLARDAAAAYRELGDELNALRQDGSAAAYLRESGRAREGLELARATLKRQEAIGDGVGAAHAYVSIGAALQYLGRTAASMDAYRIGAERARAAHAWDALFTASLGLVSMHNRVREYERGLGTALPLLDLAATHGHFRQRIYAHLAVADCYINLDQLEDAETQLAAAERLVGDRPNSYQALRTLATRSYLLRAQKKYAESLALRRQLVTRWQALPDPWQAATAQLNVVDQLLDMERAVEALPEVEKAIAMAEEVESTHLLLMAVVLRAVAGFHAPNNLIGIESVERAARLIPEVYGGLAARQSALARGHMQDALVRGAYAASTLQAIRTVWRYLETLRGMSLVEGLAVRSRVGVDAIPAALRAKEDGLRADESAAVARLRVAIAGGKRKAVRAARKDVTNVRTALRVVREEMQRALKTAADVYFVDPVDFDVARKALKPHEAILYYSAWSHVRSLGMRIEAKDYVSTLVGSEDAAVEALRRAEFGSASGDATAATKQLHKLLIEPLGLGPHIKRVYVVADGQLCEVPFGALLPDVEVVYAPSGMTAHLLRTAAAERGEGVLALGDPVYAKGRSAAPGDPERKQRGGISFRLTALPETGVEARAIGDVVLLGADANETKLRSTLTSRPRWRAVHLACHGLIDTENPMDSALALSVSEGEDGFLTGGEAQNLALNADLVTLSACETARGRVVDGDGILGLTRAFMFAGAPRVLVSLWKVDDAATRELMTTFYAKWNPRDGSKGLSAAGALRAAQAHVRAQERWKHPYYWAAWTLWGLGD